MRSTLTVFLLLTALLLVAPDICIADETDARLAQKVTYQGGYKRLHEVVSDLSAISGVTIYCGSNSSDWRVRDIPVIVCANDIPLGRLLQAVADCTHVGYYSVRKRSEDEVRRYRLFREKKDADAIPASIEARIQGNVALATWAWDALVAAAKMPDLEGKLRALDPKKLTVDPTEVVLVARTLEWAGTESRSRLLASLEKEYHPLAGGYAGFVLIIDKKLAELYLHSVPDFRFDESMVANHELRVDIRLSVITGESDMNLSFRLEHYDGVENVRKRHWNWNPVNLAEALQAVEGLDLAPKPDTCDFENESPSPGYRALTTDEDWNLPSLQTKVKLDLPEGFFDIPSVPEIFKEPFRHFDALRPKRAQVLQALSKASGYTIVCEDFLSHIMFYGPPACIGAEEGTTIAEVLRSLASGFWGGSSPIGFTWFVNEQNKVLIGWGEDWRDLHHILVPARLLSNLRAKQQGPGVELDDLTPLLHLSSEQMEMWVEVLPGFLGSFLSESNLFPDNKNLWKIYDLLSRNEKRLAKTEYGLSLAGLDPVQLSNFLCQKEEDESQRSYVDELLANPELMSRLVMRVVRVPLDSWKVRVLRVDESIDQYWDKRAGVYRPEPHGPAKHGYRLEIFEWNNEDGFRITSTWAQVPFPLYTTEREAELRKGGTTTWMDPPWH